MSIGSRKNRLFVIFLCIVMVLVMTPLAGQKAEAMNGVSSNIEVDADTDFYVDKQWIYKIPFSDSVTYKIEGSYSTILKDANCKYNLNPSVDNVENFTCSNLDVSKEDKNYVFSCDITFDVKLDKEGNYSKTIKLPEIVNESYKKDGIKGKYNIYITEELIGKERYDNFKDISDNKQHLALANFPYSEFDNKIEVYKVWKFGGEKSNEVYSKFYKSYSTDLTLSVSNDKKKIGEVSITDNDIFNDSSLNEKLDKKYHGLVNVEEGFDNIEVTKEPEGEKVIVGDCQSDNIQKIIIFGMTGNVTVEEEKNDHFNSTVLSDSTKPGSFIIVNTPAVNLKYDANGGEGSVPAIKKTLESGGTKVTVDANTFTREGYDFTGWNTAADGTGTAYNVGDNITLSEDTTLYAQWKKKESTEPVQPVTQYWQITYDANGGQGATQSQVVERGSSISVSPCGFTRDGYDFTGWNTKADGTGDTYIPVPLTEVNATDNGDRMANLAAASVFGNTITPTSDTTLYAVWKGKAAEKRTLTYDANGGDGAMEPQTADKGSAVTVKDNEFTRKGYEFTGWNTASDGTGTAYEAGDSVTLDENVTVYAQWKKTGGSSDNNGDSDNGKDTDSGKKHTDNNSGSNSGKTSPRTGDGSGLYLWTLLLAAGAAGIYAVRRRSGASK
ncbi:MAG: InlB B-repeat-containing protein [Anaerovoracaceae bacterium]